nr:vacuolar cation/proton exchanger 3-like [Ipomoea batatas]GMC75905.1 vacuolar cation/proton exchanger 3-like [Ipomoea batatas]
MGSFKMGRTEEKIDLECDEEIPFSSSPARNKMETLHYETSHNHVGSPRSSSSLRFIKRMHRISILRSIYIVIIKAKINVLLPFGPLAILLHYVTGKHVRVFTYWFHRDVAISFRMENDIPKCDRVVDVILFVVFFYLAGLGLFL